MTAFDPTTFAQLNWLRCANPGCGHETPLLSERTFKCPHCGSVYDLVHPKPTESLDPDAFEECFIPGAQAFSDIKGSGVWAWQELILPGVPADNLVTLGERVIFVPIEGHLRDWLGGELDAWLALEGLTPSGSFKDIGMPVAITTAKLSGAPLVMCASTGDTSASAAGYAAAAGIDCAVLLPKGKVSLAQLVQPLAFGARIIEVNGDFDDCMRIMRQLVEEHGVFPVNSLNPARIEGHQATVFNAWFQFQRLPDWFVLPLGNGSNTTSIGKGQRALVENLPDHSITSGRILAAQPENAAPLARSFAGANGWSAPQFEGDMAMHENWQELYRAIKVGETIATAARIGDPVSASKVMREIVHCGGGVTAVSDAEAREAMFAAGRSGHMVCPQTGLALAGLRWAVEQGYVAPGSTVVVVSTATGLKFTEVFEPIGDERHATSLDDASTSSVASVLGLS